MKISLNWLSQYIQIDKSPQQLADLLTQSGLEVEGVEKHEKVKGGLAGLVIGEVLQCEKHPGADKLSLTKVDIGEGEAKSIVCGAPNVAAGQKVIVAPVGATLYPAGGEPFQIKKAKIRGEVSEGMICAEDEIGLGTSHDGILVLDTDLPNGTPASTFFNLDDDYILEIGLTPNRGDAASHIGVARDLKALLKKEICLPDVSAFSIDNHSLPIKVQVENTQACPRYSGVTISQVTVGESPQWLKDRLLSIGLTPINNIVDITNFVLHETGQPLHAFDADKIAGGAVVVKTLPKDTEFITLDEKKRKLSAQDLMICDVKEGMCIAGVFGGLHSGVSASTQNIFLESAYFSPEYIRKTSNLHGLKTDASFRFERGADPNITIYALKRAALLIRELAGGKISSYIVDIYPEIIEDFRVGVQYKNVDRLIGKHIPRNTIVDILSRLDIKVEEKTDNGFEAIVPPYRGDVTREADVIEEILRIYGYDNIEISENVSSNYHASFPERDKSDYLLKAAELLAANGYFEIQTNSLTNPGYAGKIPSIDTSQGVGILNKLSEELGVLRQSMLFGGLEVIAYNISHRQRDLKLFEYGKTYAKNGRKYIEKEKLSIWSTGKYEPENWRHKSRPVEFHDFYLAVQKIINKFTVSDYTSAPFKDDIFAVGLKIFLGGTEIARLGKIQKAITKQAGINQEVYYSEIDFDRLLFENTGAFSFREISKFPEVRRDLSLVIDKKITFEEIKNVLQRKDFHLLKKVNVFDYYEGENLGAGKKAYALSFTLQDETKTLTDKVIDKVMSRLIEVYEKELGALIRK